MKLSTERLSLAYGPTTVVPDFTYSFAEGRITSLVGRNGCGKSTLLRALGRLIRPAGGTIVVDGKAIHEMPTRVLAQHLSILTQGPTAPEGVTVRNLVEHGRYPYRAFLGNKSEQDQRIVAWALEQTDLVALADRPLVRLSGGQQQRAWIAMALAQDTEVILLDEPTTFLDVAYQIELMELLRRLNKEHGRTILMVLHDLNQAAHYSDELVAINDGRIHSSGPPAEMLTAAMIREVFGIDAEIIKDSRTGAPLCIPHGLARGESKAATPDQSQVATA